MIADSTLEKTGSQHNSHPDQPPATKIPTSDDKMEQLFYALLHVIQDRIEKGSREAVEIQSEAFERAFESCRGRK